MYRTIDKDQYFCSTMQRDRFLSTLQEPRWRFLKEARDKKLIFPYRKSFVASLWQFIAAFRKMAMSYWDQKSLSCGQKESGFRFKMEQKQLKTTVFCGRNGEKIASAQRCYRTHKNFPRKYMKFGSEQPVERCDFILNANWTLKTEINYKR